MRLKQEEIEFLKKEILKYDKNAEIYLFGSRVDDSKKGGDIDILVKGNLSIKEIIKVRVGFFKRFGEQKLDIIIYKDDPFCNYILKKAIAL